MDLTIAICTYRRFAALRQCLENIERQTIERSRFKVLVIDNSLQPEESAAFRDTLNLDYECEYIITPKNGVAYARNQAIAHCKTPYLGYVDDDVSIEPNWAEVLLDTFVRHKGRAGCVSGKILPRYETPPPSWLKDELLWPLAVLDWGDKEKLLLDDSEWFVTASIGFDMRALRLSGGFSEDLGRKGRVLLAHEDLQIVTNLRRMGYGIVYNPDFCAEHFIPTTRMTQKWYCKDAFWQTVSHMVYASGNSFDLDGPLVGELAKAIEKEAEHWKDQPDKEMIREKLADVAAHARQLMKRHGYDSNRRYPEPAFRTFYIVTPVFNAAETIEETFESIFRQAGNHFIRYHVQDGGSTDGTLDIVRKWRLKVEQDDLPFPVQCRGIHMTWSSSPDEGMYDAIAKGFSMLSIDPDDVMTWLNADDILAETALSTMDRVFESSDAQWAVGATAVLDNNGDIVASGTYAYPDEVIKNGLCDGHFWKHIQQEGSFWRKALWDRVGGLNVDLKLAGDWDLWRRFAWHAEPVHVDAATGYFRMRDGQLSSSIWKYDAEIDATLPKERRRFAAAALAAEAPDTWFQRFDVVSGQQVVERLTPRYFPRQAFENYQDFSRKFFTRSANELSASRTAKVLPKGWRSVLNVKSRLRELVSNPTTRQMYQSLPRPVQRPLQLFRRRVLTPLARKFRAYREYRLLHRSSLFFRRFYLETYPDVAANGADPLMHYISFGAKEGRSPNPLFSETYYRNAYPDVAHGGASGLAHYVRAGWKERRDPHPDFSTSFYLSTNPDIELSGINPLFHYLFHGLREGRLAKWNEGDSLHTAAPAVFPPTENDESKPRPNKAETNSPEGPRKWLEGKSYSKKSHWREFEPAAQSLLDKTPEPESVDLKVYQDLFVASFIERFAPKGARILEIGGGDSRILRHFSRGYECWNVDKLEGCGNGPKEADIENVKLVRDYMGNFSVELPDSYFDFVFSISVLEHVPENEPGLYRDILEDIARVSKAGCQNLHLVDVVYKQEAGFIWACDLLKDWLPKLAQTDWPSMQARMMKDDDLFIMSKSYYERSWRHVTGKSYEQFGAPVSLNLCWTC